MEGKGRGCCCCSRDRAVKSDRSAVGRVTGEEGGGHEEGEGRRGEQGEGRGTV